MHLHPGGLLAACTGHSMYTRACPDTRPGPGARPVPPHDLPYSYSYQNCGGPALVGYPTLPYTTYLLLVLYSCGVTVRVRGYY